MNQEHQEQQIAMAQKEQEAPGTVTRNKIWMEPGGAQDRLCQENE